MLPSASPRNPTPPTSVSSIYSAFLESAPSSPKPTTASPEPASTSSAPASATPEPTPASTKPAGAKGSRRRTYESAWWSRKQYSCDFKTTNVELYKWHTTHLKVEEQKAVAVARAEAAQAAQAPKTASKPTTPSISPFPTSQTLGGSTSDGAPPTPEGFIYDNSTPADLGLLRHAVTGKLVMPCTAAFAVRSRLERHINGKHPKGWGKKAKDEDWCCSGIDGVILGKLREDRGDAQIAWTLPTIVPFHEAGSIHPHQGIALAPNAKEAVRKKTGGKKKPIAPAEQTEEKKKAIASAEKNVYICTWPCCDSQHATGWDLQLHFTKEHKIPIPTGPDGRQKMFDVVPRSTLQTLQSLSPSSTPSTSTPSPFTALSEFPRHLLISTFHLAMWRILFRKLGTRVIGAISEQTLADLAGELMQDVDFSEIEDALLEVATADKQQVGSGQSISEGTSSIKGKGRMTRSSTNGMNALVRSDAAAEAQRREFCIDPLDVPFPTVDELEVEIVECLQEQEMVGGGGLHIAGEALGGDVSSASSSRTFATNVRQTLDFDATRPRLSRWSRDHLVIKAMAFVTTANGLAKESLKRRALNGDGVRGSLHRPEVNVDASGPSNIDDDHQAAPTSVLSGRTPPSSYLSTSPFITILPYAPPSSSSSFASHPSATHIDEHPPHTPTHEDPENVPPQLTHYSPPQTDSPPPIIRTRRSAPVRTIPAALRAKRTRSAFSDENVALIARMGSKILRDEENGSRKIVGTSGRVPLSPVKVVGREAGRTEGGSSPIKRARGRN
ncbi:hypothetical protein HK097_008207 [Rhizophlyctis rosea]|uniref:Uncharacterized protein n=1 Tax=Rhizophlyctis rosea TaxID=64517 RepID=A0AAD5X7X2_9FUNG|nr:hypothetical protein HK097_008207 [Rhizophlyctis rosea]